ncbi:MAG TPA: hypothetical protein VNT76_03315, partial [Candidatus Binatus sp.]|nr:hypothetical protein [Candidatus Binatus sp.]
MAADDKIGQVSVDVVGKLDKLQASFEEAERLAKAAGVDIAKAMSDELAKGAATTQEALDRVIASLKAVGGEADKAGSGFKGFSEGAQAVVDKQQKLNDAVTQSATVLSEIYTAYTKGATGADVLARAQSDLEQSMRKATVAQDEQVAGFQKFIDGSQALTQAGATITAAITVPIIGIGAAAVSAANELDESYDHIRAATGQTGATLDGLQDSFRKVFAEVPASAKDVSDAMALIFQRTSMVGAPLEDLTAKMVNLAHVSGEQVVPLTNQVTRAFADAGIKVQDQSKALDEMLRASQATGMSLTEMLSRVVQFGAPMREFKFSFEESLAV